MDAERDERILDLEDARSQPLRRHRNDLPECVLLLDRLIGRQDKHDLLVWSVDRGRREGDRSGGVLSGRLDDQPNVGGLVPDELTVPTIGHAVDVVVTDERRDPAHGPLEERLVGEEREEGLGALRPAERPEPGPATAGEDHDIHGRPF